MASSRLIGLNYELDGSVVNFFDVKGMKLSGGNWVVNGIQVVPDSVMRDVRRCIAEAVANGKDDSISQLQLGAPQAVIFYLEGGLTGDHLKDADEGTDFIDVRDVEVEGRRLTVRIQANPRYDVAVADTEGVVL